MGGHDRQASQRGPGGTTRRRTRGALVALAVLAAVAVVVVRPDGASAGPAPVMTGYVPLPADDFQGYLESINTAANTTLDFTVGITNAGNGSVMYYDHWEDGFEADLTAPAQSTTLVFGDSDTGNGDAGAFCSTCSGDVLTQGAALIMRNDVATPRDSDEVRFDGGDLVASTRGFAITAGGFSTPLDSVLSGVVSAYDVSKYGTRYTVPVGEDTPHGANQPFEYTGASVMAAEDDTVVQVDDDADGVTDTSQTVDQGEALFIDGGLSEGATIRSSAPVQVHLLTGLRDSMYQARSYTLFSDDLLSNDYLAPAGTGTSDFRTANYLYNPSDTDLTVTPSCASCSGTITVPANGSASFLSPLGEAVRFSAPAGRTFIGIGAIGGQSTETNARTYDWGFPMLPTAQLTTQVVLGWAPGNSNDPPTTTGNEERYDPVWVTTLADTTVRVDFDGDPDTGDIADPDCFGDNHDQEIPVTALASTRIFDADDGDMTGARIYTCDGTNIAGAWGQDPAFATAQQPGFDAGYTIIPTTTMLVQKSASLVTDEDGDGGFGPGDRMTYEIAIADAGSLAFTDVQLEDVLPEGLSYVPDSTTLEVDGSFTPIADDAVPPAATAFPLDDGVGLPDIAAGATVYVRFDADITEPWSLDTNVLGNTACVVANEAEACDTSQTGLTTADVSLTKTETASPAHVGDLATFEVTVANDGPDDAPGVEVTDLLPAGLTYVSDDGGGDYDEATGVWDVGTVAVGESATLHVTATVDTTDPTTNVAEVSSGGFVDPDSQPAEDPLGPDDPPNQDDEGSATVDVDPLADLWVTKDETASPAHVGDEATFEVTVGNDGPSPATGVEVTDLLPAGLTYVSDDGGGDYDEATGVWSVGDLAVDAEETLTITATVDAEGAVTNGAELTAANEDDPDSTPDNDDPTEDDQDSAGVSTEPLIDLSLTKAQTGSPTHPGDDATFEITVHNDGPSDATGVEVTDLLPAGATYVSDDAGGDYDETTGVWDVGDLAVGTSATLTIETTVEGLTVVNVAEVTAADQDDADSQPAEDALGPDDPPNQDDEGSATVTLDPLADLSVDKAQTGSPTHVGDQATFVVTVTNDGPNDATGIEVTDLLPAGLTFVAADASQGSYDDATGLWTVGDLATGADATLTIDATVDTAEPVTNEAELTAANEDDPDSTPDNDDPGEDDQDDAEVDVDPLVDVHLDKAVTTAPTYLGDQATYTITVGNDGPSDATGVEVTDLLPAGVTYVSDDGGGDYDETTGVWAVGGLADGATRSLAITVVVDELSVDNEAEVTATDQDDADSTPDNDDPGEDDQDDAPLTVEPVADLELTKTSSPSTVDQGDDATFTLTLHNAGPSDATGVVVTDVLPAGVSFDGADASHGAYDETTGRWTVGDLAAGDTATLDIDVVVDDAGPITNTAQVTASDQHDPDSTPDNDDPGEDDQDSTVLTSDPVIDLSVTKDVSAPSAHVGDEVTYTVTVANDGPSDATGVEVTDLLPAGVAFVGAVPSQGGYDDSTGTWTVGDVDEGGDATLELTVEVLDAGDLVNVAQVTDADQQDVDSEPAEDALGPDDPPNQDDEAAASLVGVQIDLELDVAASASAVDVGDEVTFTVTLVNQGPSAATGVSVLDALPAGLTVTGASTATGSYSDGTWTVGSLGVGETVTLDVTARVTEAGPLVYGAQVQTAVEPDVDSTPANDQLAEDDQDAVAVVGVEADLSLTKTVDETSPGLGEPVTYTLTLTNDGPSDATGVVVQEELADGLEWVGDSGGGAYDHETGRWTVGSLAAGDTVQLSITARVMTTGPVVNRAAVLEADQPDPDSTPGIGDDEDDDDEVDVTAEPASIGGLVWLDLDGDGVLDAIESPIAEVTMLLFDEGDDLVASTATDDEGRYVFTDLVPGDYMVVVDDTTLPAVVAGQTYDPDDVMDGQHEVDLPGGEHVEAVDFAYEPVPEPFNPVDDLDDAATELVDDVLARTGTDVWWQVRAALALIALGTLFLLRRRRPRTA